MSRNRHEKIWISRGEACRQLGVCSITFGRLVDDGRIGTLELPGVNRRTYSASDVAALVNAGTVPAKRERELVEA